MGRLIQAASIIPSRKTGHDAFISALEEPRIPAYYPKKITVVTHDHPEGLKGAEATAAAIYLARTGKRSIPKNRSEKTSYTS